MSIALLVAAAVAARTELVTAAQAIMKDESLPLEERWTVLEEATDFLPIADFGDGFIEKLAPHLTAYDDFYMERYGTWTYKDMLEGMVDRLSWDEDSRTKTWDIDNWKRAVLASGYGGFTHDW